MHVEVKVILRIVPVIKIIWKGLFSVELKELEISFSDLSGINMKQLGLSRNLCRYLPEENVNLELEVECTEDSCRS